MKRSSMIAVATLLAAAPAGFASDLALSVRSGGQASVTVGPGANVPYQVVGELSDNLNLGLAMFAFDLGFSGGALAPADPPSTSPMVSFDKPTGLTNPAGFGGTPAGGVLLQVGGAQNTIANAFAPYPLGPVTTGVAQNGSPQVLVSGALTTPYKVGSYSLAPSNVMANVIRQGETGTPFWRVDATGAGSISSLNVVVEAIAPAAPSVMVGQSVALFLDAGPLNAGRSYRVLGSTTPGNPGPRALLPLVHDAYYQFTVANPNSAILQSSLGVLDGQGKATAVFTPDNSFAGLTAFHAFYVGGGRTIFVSNAAAVQVVSSATLRK